MLSQTLVISDTLVRSDSLLIINNVAAWKVKFIHDTYSYILCQFLCMKCTTK